MRPINGSHEYRVKTLRAWCPEQKRLCVIKDAPGDSCRECASWDDQRLGIRSTFDIEGLQR